MLGVAACFSRSVGEPDLGWFVAGCRCGYVYTRYVYVVVRMVVWAETRIVLPFCFSPVISCDELCILVCVQLGVGVCSVGAEMGMQGGKLSSVGVVCMYIRVCCC